VVWGGTADSQMLADGAAFNPQTGRWRTIASESSAGAIRPVVVWTGREMLVVSGGNTERSTSAYDPSSDRWRPLTPPPGSLVMPYPQAVWTGTQAVLVLWGTGAVGSVGPGRGAADTGSAAPTLAEGTAPVGTVPPAPPGLRPPGPPPMPMGGGPNSNMFLASYSPESDQWSRLPDVEMKDGSLPRLVWTGREVLVLQSAMPGAAFDPEQQTWRPIKPVPNEAASSADSAVWTGNLALLWSGGRKGLAYNPEADVWRTFDAGGLGNRSGAVVAWADGVFVGWGGFNNHDNGNGRLENNGIRYIPPLG